jgi:hypothetical protein
MSKYEFESLTDLGKKFGVSNQQVGKWLDLLGLRVVGGSPTTQAFELGLVKTTPTGRGNANGYFYTWHAEKTLKLLEEAGRQRIDTAAASKPHPLVGPFSKRRSGINGYEILNRDGEVVYCTIGESNASVLVKILNALHKVGKLPPQQ